MQRTEKRNKMGNLLKSYVMAKCSILKSENFRLNEKKNPTLCCQQESCFKYEDINKLKVREWNKIYFVDTKHNITRMTILIADGVDFRKKNVTRNKEHFIIMEG